MFVEISLLAPAWSLSHRLSSLFRSFPFGFLGIGYEMGDNDDNKSDMKRWQAQAEAAFLVPGGRQFLCWSDG